MLIAKQAAYDDAKFSPDGARVVVNEGIGSRRDLWLYDIQRETTTRLTFESDNFFPAWSPDGRAIAFTSRRAGPAGIFIMSVDGTSAPRPLVNTNILSFSGSFSADGRTLYYRRTELRQVGCAVVHSCSPSTVRKRSVRRVPGGDVQSTATLRVLSCER